ncbi:aminotransferase class V [Nitrosococcus halophilus Nc 4]|uniref:Aminotransferase class V n=1 Tax=Nitrosococcus halophilus (strain Nc4) TaxID=472759 RepID=D5BZT3_NITHN|nr:aminotransferase class V [Nitrosococcus halophilus Nc 4]
MCARRLVVSEIEQAVRALGVGPLTEAGLISHIHPLFSRVLRHSAGEIYLANHSLGRPLDRTAQDVATGLDCWYQRMDEAWEDWQGAIHGFREQMAQLLQAPRADCVVPKASAGQALRAVLNCYDQKIQVVTTRGEFNSIDFILKVYAQRDRIALTFVEPDQEGHYHLEDVLTAMGEHTDLVVISMVMFVTGQRLADLKQFTRAAQDRGARVLVDLYHAVGVFPVEVEALGADFVIGGCYKYLRGGPGACWLYLHPRHLDGSLVSLDTGWFAQEAPFAFQRPSPPRFARGGDAFLESTTAILPFYQARAGLDLTLALGVERLRTYSLGQLSRLRERLAGRAIKVFGSLTDCGAFVAIPHPEAAKLSQRLAAQGVRTDAREGYLRLGPDILNTEEEIDTAVDRLVTVWEGC